jgi:hypothetical protein
MYTLDFWQVFAACFLDCSFHTLVKAIIDRIYKK